MTEERADSVRKTGKNRGFTGEKQRFLCREKAVNIRKTEKQRKQMFFKMKSKIM